VYKKERHNMIKLKISVKWQKETIIETVKSFTCKPDTYDDNETRLDAIRDDGVHIGYYAIKSVKVIAR
jgi:hypothetical protein